MVGDGDGDATDLFEGQRQTAVRRDNSRPPTIEEESPEVERSNTYVPPDASYGYGGPAREVSPPVQQTPPIRLASTNRESIRLQSPPTIEEREVNEPWTVRLFYETLLRWIAYPFQAAPPHVKDIIFFVPLILLLFLTFGPAGEQVVRARSQILNSVASTIGLNTTTSLRYNQTADPLYYAPDDKDLYTRVGRLETDVSRLQSHEDQLSKTTYENLILNMHSAMRELNYFSASFGAVVDPRLTSPTQQPPRLSLSQRLYAFVPWMPSPNAPAAALQRWDEATDCWCAAPSNHGKAQIAILMAHEIYPDSLTIEHIPAAGTLNIAAAPQNLEIWAYIAEADRQKVEALTSSVKPSKYRSGGKCGDRTYPVKGYVCIGKARYDIHDTNNVQSFKVDIELQSIDVAVNKIVVRVNSNWGADWTCLYRLRMHGSKKVPIKPIKPVAWVEATN